MAIQVVQGLIETGRQRSQSSSPSPQSSPIQQTQQTAQSQVAVAQAAAKSTSHVAQVHVASEAALVTVRAGRLGGESEKIRDGDTAKKVADTVANEIRDRSPSADGAHRSLSATNAREHFA